MPQRKQAAKGDSTRKTRKTRKPKEQDTPPTPPPQEAEKPKAETAAEENDEEDLGRMTVYEVRLTRMELAHLRDLFSIKLPPDMSVSLSEALAESQARPFVESKLWQKLTATMKQAGVPLEDEAPDFTVLPTGPAPMGVFQVEATDNQVRDMMLQAAGMQSGGDEEEEEDE